MKKIIKIWLCIFSCALFTIAGNATAFRINQNILSVDGSIVDQTGAPIYGATVIVSGTTNITTSDSNGKFTLKDVAENAQLQISFIGFKTQNISLNGKSNLNIVLVEDRALLDEAVVVGYGKMKKSDLTGSVSSVKIKELPSTPSNSVENILQGKVAGLQVINSSQDPGAASTIRIRGNSSLNGSNAPLIVIDGFAYGDAGNLQQINPQDIISMEVLKDASASAIYGSRGANGVILITTRKAQGNKTTIKVHQQTTISQFSSKLDLWRDPVLMAYMSNESRANSDLTQLYIGERTSSGIYYPSIDELKSTWTTNTQWDDLVFRDTPMSDNTTIQLESNTDRMYLAISANYYDENGMYIKDDYQKYGGNFAIQYKVYDNFKIKASTNITQNKRNNNGWLSYNRNPIYPVYDENGDYWQYSADDYYNPIALSDLQKNKSNGLDIISYVGFDWDILPSLKWSTQLNYKHGESTSDVYYPDTYSLLGTFSNGYGKISNWKDDKVNIESYLTYDKEFNEKHHLTIMGGYSYENYNSRSSYLVGKDFVNESLQNENLASGNPESYEIGNDLTKTEMVSGMTRINYIFNQKYLATFTARMDGSSKFGDDNKYAFFPSGALSWKAGQESFIKRLNIFDQLKIRTSYGISGNQGISAYQTLSQYGQHKYYYNGNWVTAIGPGYASGTTGQDGIFTLWSGIANTKLKWETTSQLDLGLDMSFLDEKLNVTFDWYNKQTHDLLRQRNIAPSSGYDRMWINNGEIENKGIELTLDAVLYRNNDWNVSGTFIFYRNRNKVKSLGDATETGLQIDTRTGMQYEFYGNSIEKFRGYPNILAVDQPLFLFYGYKTDGIIQTPEEGIAAGLEGEDAQPGEYKYVNTYDGDGLGIINEDDRCVIGDPNPDWSASMNLSASYKRWDANIFFNGVFGNDVLNTQRFDTPSVKPLRWTIDNPTNDYPSLREDRSIKLSDWWIEDGSFIRIQDLTVGYTLPVKISDVSRNIRFYLTASNLYTFTKFDGYDPEVSQTGIYYGGYPRLRKWTIGIDFTF